MVALFSTKMKPAFYPHILHEGVVRGNRAARSNSNKQAYLSHE
jgi:hypothetical protein